MHNARVMATPKPGEIRCPTCHRSTPPAAFCTQCGSVIPPDARIRPRGMDREELQERIRARRSDADPYFRGADVDDGTGIYERFEPDPADRMARRAAPQGGERRQDFLDERASPAPMPTPPPPDLTRDRDEWVAPVAPTPVATPPPATPPPPAAEPAPDWAATAEPPPPVDDFDDLAYGDGGDDYGYADWEDEPRRRSGGGALAVLGFLGLGVLALVAGAVLANVFGGAVGSTDPTPTPAISVEPSVAETPVVTVEPSPSEVPSASAEPSDGPIVFPDGFEAQVQPCLPGSAGGSGCDSNGVVNSGSVDIWIGFKNGARTDVIGAILEAPDGTTYDQSIDLARIGCGAICNGYTRFGFSSLPPGDYVVRITRNGDPAASTTFEVS